MRLIILLMIVAFNANAASSFQPTGQYFELYKNAKGINKYVPYTLPQIIAPDIINCNSAYATNSYCVKINIPNGNCFYAVYDKSKIDTINNKITCGDN